MEVRLDRLLRETEPGRDLGVGPAGHDRRDDLALAIRRTARGAAHPREVGRRIDRASPGDSSHRRDDRADFDALVEVASRATLDSGPNDRVVAVAGDQQDRGRGIGLARHVEDTQAVASLELDVAQEDVRSSQQRDSVVERPARPGEGEVRFRVDGGRQRRENRRVIVNDADTDRSIHRSPA